MTAGEGTTDQRPGAAPGTPGGAAPRVRSRRRIILRLLQVAIVAATVYFLAAYLVRSWSSIEDFDWTFDAGWLAASAAAFLAFYFAQAVFWWLLLRGCGARGAFWPAASVWGKSILVRYMPGNVFMFVGRAWMSHSQGHAVERVTAAMVYEQALGLCGALLAMAVLFPFWEYKPGLTALSLLAMPVLVALMHPRVFGPLAGRVLRLLKRPPLEVTLRFGAVLGFLCLFTVDWLVAGAGAWLLARAVTGLDRRRAAAGHRRQRARVRRRHGRLLHPQWHRRAGGRAHGLPREGAPGWRRTRLGVAPPSVGDRGGARLRGPRRGHRAAGAPEE